MAIKINSDFRVSFTDKDTTNNAMGYDEENSVLFEDEEDIDISQIELLKDWD